MSRSTISTFQLFALRGDWERAALVPITHLTPQLTCPALQGNACSIYSVRPLICRLWGVVRKMACPFGCQPERWLSDTEAFALMKKLDALSAGVVDGPRLRGEPDGE